MNPSIYIGFDPRETEAFAVCRHSLRRHTSGIPIHAIDLETVRDAGLYWRPTSRKDGRLWDDISEAPMATEFAISRFLTPILAREGWALFMDCDILARADLYDLFALADPKYAAMCVKHHHVPTAETLKMDGQMQTLYARKNWSSVVLYNCEHPSNRKLTVDLINKVPGRDLHRFCWLGDAEIGELPPQWNYLVGHTDPTIEPALCHYTEGGPWFEGYRDVPYAKEWLAERRCWLSGSHSIRPPVRHIPKRNGVDTHV
jgi:hypothetical protein